MLLSIREELFRAKLAPVALASWQGTGDRSMALKSLGTRFGMRGSLHRSDDTLDIPQNSKHDAEASVWDGFGARCHLHRFNATFDMRRFCSGTGARPCDKAQREAERSGVLGVGRAKPPDAPLRSRFRVRGACLRQLYSGRASGCKALCIVRMILTASLETPRSWDGF